MADVASQSVNNGRIQRPPRSKNGCETCRRRKVRCNERKPRCVHCERLNLQCTWRPSARAPAEQSVAVQRSMTSFSTTQDPTGLQDYADDWDFNNLIWQDTSTLIDASLDWAPQNAPFGPDSSISISGSGNVSAASAPSGPITPSRVSHHHSNSLFSQLPNDGASPVSSVEGGSHALVEHFLASDVPPILASVEVGPRWTSTKMLFASLAASSGMVRNGVMAFSALQVGSEDDALHTEYRLLYQKASTQLSRHISAAQADPEKMASELPWALATVFFLSYSDLLTSRINDAHSRLQEAMSLVRIYKLRELTLVEKRLISWIRLIDGRASSAGGDGAFLAETEDEAYSPEAHQRSASRDLKVSGHTSDLDQEIEEILFDTLYTPGLVFYQKVQSIVARVANIDPWHRTRGTVSDETEVMAAGARILADLRSLYCQRPPLMDHAVAGSLNETHIAKDIARSIRVSHRTYFANYEAGFIHLHRVAHKHLPPTADVIRARSTIKRIARLFEHSDDTLGSSWIWPLLMCCVEEDDLEDRRWMISTIRNFQSRATNARPIADVLEEVHRRQDSTKQRADIRQASMDLFNMSFAVV